MSRMTELARRSEADPLVLKYGVWADPVNDLNDFIGANLE